MCAIVCQLASPVSWEQVSRVMSSPTNYKVFARSSQGESAVVIDLESSKRSFGWPELSAGFHGRHVVAMLVFVPYSLLPSFILMPPFFPA